MVEIDGERGGGQRGGDPPQPGIGTAPGHPAGARAQNREQQRLPQDHRAEAAGAVDQVPDRLRQPFVSEVEAAGGGLIGGDRRGGGRGVGERIGRGQAMLGNDVLAGLQVPPEIGVDDFGAEQPQQQQRGEREQSGREPPRRKLRG